MKAQLTEYLDCYSPPDASNRLPKARQQILISCAFFDERRWTRRSLELDEITYDGLHDELHRRICSSSVVDRRSWQVPPAGRMLGARGTKPFMFRIYLSLGIRMLDLLKEAHDVQPPPPPLFSLSFLGPLPSETWRLSSS